MFDSNPRPVTGDKLFDSTLYSLTHFFTTKSLNNKYNNLCTSLPLDVFKSRCWIGFFSTEKSFEARFSNKRPKTPPSWQWTTGNFALLVPAQTPPWGSPGGPLGFVWFYQGYSESNLKLIAKIHLKFAISIPFTFWYPLLSPNLYLLDRAKQFCGSLEPTIRSSFKKWRSELQSSGLGNEWS